MQKVIYKPNALQHVRDTEVGEGVFIYDFVEISGAKIGADTKISTFVEIQPKVTIGERCKICSHIFICEGVTIEDEVFIGHGTVFISSQLPSADRSDNEKKSLAAARVGKGASIGSGVVIVGGVSIGRRATVGAGAVVLDDVPEGSTVVGNPAQIIKQKTQLS